MPSLEDLGTRQIVTGTPAAADRVAFYDVSEFGNNPVKKTTAAALLTGAGGAAFPADASVVVSTAESDTGRATALVGAYAAAKLLTPNGAARSAANRVTVYLPPGAYDIGSTTFVLDAEWIDVSAVYPEMGGVPSPDDDWLIGSNYQPLSVFRPPRTYLYTDNAGITVLRQSVRDVRLTGFGVAQIHQDPDYQANSAPQHAPCNAFELSLTTSTANDLSRYDRMYFWHATPFALSDGVLGNGHHPTGFAKHVGGTWIQCIDGAMAMRVGLNGTFFAEMHDCMVGPYSVGGDASGGSMGPCRLERVRGVGKLLGTGDGFAPACFGGCNSWGINATSSAWFVDCEAGYGSFNIGAVAGGNYIRCRARENSFGSGTSEPGFSGRFSGYAEDCYAGPLSFGALIAGDGKVTGTLRRCTVSGTGNQDAGWRLEGARIYGCRLPVGVLNVHALTLLDSSSVVYDSEVIVNASGTGVPVYAASSLNVRAAHCRFNNADNDADGIHANVTNLIGTPYNVVDDDVL